MTDSVAQKAIALMLLIVTGYVFRQNFRDPAAKGAIRYFILNVALPATIFLSVIEIDTQLDLLRLPSFALGVNFFLLLIGFLLAMTLFRGAEKSQTRALILLFPSLAPGLTVYPFIEQFLGKSGLAWAALADMGNKLFVLIGLYTLAIYWFQQSTAAKSQTSVKAQWGNIGRFLMTEPVNLAIVLGVVITSLHLSPALPPALTNMIQRFAVCATPLIMFYVGISLNLKSFQFGTLLLVLLTKAGAGFLFSAAAILVLQPQSVEEVTLFVALPQASFSLWPLLHATKINSQQFIGASDPSASFFDTEFATALLAMSFPFSILVLLVVFSNGAFFASPAHLSLVGGGVLLVFAGLYGVRSLPIRLQNPFTIQVKVRNPILYTPKPVPLTPPEVLNLNVFQTFQSHRESPTMASVEQEIALAALYRVLQKYWSQEMQDPAIVLRFRYILEGHQLIVIGQHRTGSVVNLEAIVGNLEAEIHVLQISFVEQIRLYFKLVEQQKPYRCVAISLKSHASTPLPVNTSA